MEPQEWTRERLGMRTWMKMESGLKGVKELAERR